MVAEGNRIVCDLQVVKARFACGDVISGCT
jgi:hypothetical protein